MLKSAKEIAYIAVFCALVVGGQYLFAALPGVEIVTLSFVAYAYAFGPVRGCLCATAFSFLRQFLFGFFPAVLILYLIYFNLLSLCFGLLGKAWRGKELKTLGFITLIACVGTLSFNLIDVGLNVLFLGLKGKALEVYFIASWSFTIPHLVSTLISVFVGFYPLQKSFAYACSKL